MDTHSMPVLCLTIMGFVLLKMSTAVETEHCIGPIEPVQVVGVRVVPERGDANFIKMKLRSPYKLELYLTVDGLFVVQDKMVDGSSTRTTISQDGNDYVIIITSPEGVNTSSISLDLRSQHPCNTMMLWLDFVVLRHMFEAGISFPALSVFPKRAYRLDKDDGVQLRYGITYKDDGKLRETYNDFNPSYIWNETNILHSLSDEDAPKVNEEPREFETRRTNSTKNGFITLTSEIEMQPGPTFPLDGGVLLALKTFVIGEVYSKELHMYVFTSLQFTDNSDGLPMGVEPLVLTESLYQLGYQKQQGLNVLIVGLNYRIPEGRRGIRCFAVGLDRAPTVVAARLTSTNGVKGDITDAKLLDNPFSSPQMVGVLGSTEFKVNLPLGSEAYYVCSASTGDKVTTTIVKVVSMVPLEVAIEDERI